jgi:hypothetical protein
MITLVRLIHRWLLAILTRAEQREYLPYHRTVTYAVRITPRRRDWDE